MNAGEGVYRGFISLVNVLRWFESPFRVFCKFTVPHKRKQQIVPNTPSYRLRANKISAIEY